MSNGITGALSTFVEPIRVWHGCDVSLSLKKLNRMAVLLKVGVSFFYGFGMGNYDMVWNIDRSLSGGCLSLTIGLRWWVKLPPTPSHSTVVTITSHIFSYSKLRRSPPGECSDLSVLNAELFVRIRK